MLKPRLLMVLLLMLAACSHNGASSPSASVAAPAAGADPDASLPAFPKDAQFTIYCARVTGPGHVERAKRSRDTLKESTPLKDWYLVIQNDQTLLYHGYYASIEDKRAQHDRQMILGMQDKMGTYLFRQAVFVELTTQDPAAPPEWNLQNASGVYTIQIGVYRGNPQRKEAAVESVRQARAQGVEAYYYHGDSASLVCIGSWPASAIKVVGGADAKMHGDPEQPVIVAPMTSDASINEMYDQAAKQNNAKLIREEIQILDPTLQAKLKEYPYNSLNGDYIKRKVGGTDQLDHSLIWQIPKGSLVKKPQATNKETASNQPAYDPNYRPQLPRQTAPPSPPQQPQPGSGRLRSIGD